MNWLAGWAICAATTAATIPNSGSWHGTANLTQWNAWADHRSSLTAYLCPWLAACSPTGYGIFLIRLTASMPVRFMHGRICRRTALCQLQTQATNGWLQCLTVWIGWRDKEPKP